jgi:hypothetical protein
MDVQEQRRNRRFELRLPLELVRAGSRRVGEVVETMNLSSGGVLFASGQEIEIGSPIEYFITLPSSPKNQDGVRLHCMGKVVRRQLVRNEKGEEEPTAIAATLERYEFVRNEA